MSEHDYSRIEDRNQGGERYDGYGAHRDRVRGGAVVAEDASGLGGVAVIRGGGIPNLRCRVNDGVSFRVPTEHVLSEHARKEDFSGGDEVVLEGPSAHHLEELGYITILGVAE